MASKFTKDDFENFLAQNGLTRAGFSEADLKHIDAGDYEFGMGLASYKSKYRQAQTPEERARFNQMAEDLRSQSYGYRGGDNGMYYMPEKKSPTDFSYNEAPTFSYDMKSDPVYQAYQKQYAREGSRAAENALGAAAAATGGRPSSYATVAAAQAGNQYAAEMADKVPELYDMAYGRYKNELTQYNTDKNFAYDKFMDEYQTQVDEYNQKYTDADFSAKYGDYNDLHGLGVNTDNYMEEKKWQQYLKESRNSELLSKAEIAVKAGDSSALYKLLGMKISKPDESFNQNFKAAQLAVQAGNYGPLYRLLYNYGY